jgi:hypothetical protein
MLPERLPITAVPDGLPEFVENVLLPTLTSSGTKTIWCPEWQEHPDAVTRLAAIWDAWTHMLAEEDALLHSFLRDVLDWHMPYLVEEDRGAFRRCNFGHKPFEQLNEAKRAADRTDAGRRS